MNEDYLNEFEPIPISRQAKTIISLFVIGAIGCFICIVTFLIVSFYAYIIN